MEKVSKVKVKKTAGEIVFDVFLYIFISLFIIIILYPMIHLFAVSFSDPDRIRDGSVSLIPVGFNIDAYKIVFSDSQLFTAYWNTIWVTVVTCGLSLLLSTFAAYPLAFGRFKLKKVYSKFIVLTMFLSAGLIPNYIIIHSLGLNGNLWSLVLSGLLGAYNIIVIRSSFDGLPKALIESARIDGANDFKTLFRIIIPCSLPILSTVALWIIIGQWNSYMIPLVYLDGEEVTLQLYLSQVIKDAAAIYSGVDAADPAFTSQIRNAAIVCSIVPILIVFPFAQKFLVNGVTVGAVKE